MPSSKHRDFSIKATRCGMSYSPDFCEELIEDFDLKQSDLHDLMPSESFLEYIHKWLGEFEIRYSVDKKILESAPSNKETRSLLEDVHQSSLHLNSLLEKLSTTHRSRITRGSQLRYADLNELENTLRHLSAASYIAHIETPRPKSGRGKSAGPNNTLIFNLHKLYQESTAHQSGRKRIEAFISICINQLKPHPPITSSQLDDGNKKASLAYKKLAGKIPQKIT